MKAHFLARSLLVRYLPAQYLLVALGLIALLAQSVSANAVHQHPQPDGELVMVMTMEHSHDAMMNQAGDHGHHHQHTMVDTADQDINNSSGQSDCCDDQCQCSLTTCSTLYALASHGWSSLTEFTPQCSYLRAMHLNPPINSLFRPPIL